MMLMLMMILRLDDVDVDDVIMMMYVMYIRGGAVNMLDIPRGGNKVFKEF